MRFFIIYLSAVSLLAGHVASADEIDSCVEALAGNVSLPAEAFSVCGDTQASYVANEYFEDVLYEDYVSTPSPRLDEITRKIVEHNQAAARWYGDAVEDQARAEYLEDRIYGLVGGALEGAGALGGPLTLGAATAVVEISEWWKKRNQVSAQRRIAELHHHNVQEGIALMDRFAQMTRESIEEHGVEGARAHYDAYIENTLKAYNDVDVDTLEENLLPGQELAWTLKKLSMTEDKLVNYVGYLHAAVDERFDRHAENDQLLANAIVSNQVRIENLEEAGRRRDLLIADNFKNINALFDITKKQTELINDIQIKQEILFDAVEVLQNRVEINTQRIQTNTENIAQNYILAKQNEKNIFLIKNILFGKMTSAEQLQYLDEFYMDGSISVEEKNEMRLDIEARKEQEDAIKARQDLVESLKKYDKLGTEVFKLAQNFGIFGDHADDAAKVFNVLKAGVGAAIAMISDPTGISMVTGVLGFANAVFGSFFGSSVDVGAERHKQVMEAFEGINRSLEAIGQGIIVIDKKIEVVISQNNRIIEFQGRLFENQVMISEQLNNILAVSYKQYADLKSQLLIIYRYINETDKRDINTCFQVRDELSKEFEDYVFYDDGTERLSIRQFRSKVNDYAESRIDIEQFRKYFPYLPEFNRLVANKPFSMFSDYAELANQLTHNYDLSDCLSALDEKFEAGFSPDFYFDPILTVVSLDNQQVKAMERQYRANYAYLKDYGEELFYSLVTPSFEYEMAREKVAGETDFQPATGVDGVDVEGYEQSMIDILSPYTVSRLTDYVLEYHRFYALTDASADFLFLTPSELSNPSTFINDRARRLLEYNVLPTLNAATAQFALLNGEAIAPLIYEQLAFRGSEVDADQYEDAFKVLSHADRRGYQEQEDYHSQYRSSLLVNLVRYHIIQTMKKNNSNFFSYGLALADTTGRGENLAQTLFGKTFIAPGHVLKFEPVYEPSNEETTSCADEGADCRWYLNVSLGQNPEEDDDMEVFSGMLSVYNTPDSTLAETENSSIYSRTSSGSLATIDLLEGEFVDYWDTSTSELTTWRVPMPTVEAVRDEQMHMHPIVRRLLLQRAKVLDKIASYTVEDSMTERERHLYRSAAAGGAL